MADDDRILGARDGIVSGMLVIRRQIGALKSRRDYMPKHWTAKRARLNGVIEMLEHMDAELDCRRKECADAWRERQAVEIVSSLRPDFGKPLSKRG